MLISKVLTFKLSNLSLKLITRTVNFGILSFSKGDGVGDGVDRMTEAAEVGLGDSSLRARERSMCGDATVLVAEAENTTGDHKATMA